MRAFPFAVSLVLANAEQEVTVNAVQKIIGMLTDMSTKCKQEMKDEQVAFAEFEAFCANGKPQLKKKIAKSGETIETLNAEIGKLTSDVANLGEEIAALQADVTKFEADKKAHEAASEKDHKAFIEESTDYSESVDALDRAIQVLSEKDGNIAGASMLQLSMNDKRMPAKAKSLISAFLGLDDADSFEPPEANAYESQSGGIIEMLKKLKDEFRAKLGQCQKEEMNRAHAVNMVQQDLTDSIDNANKDIEEKTAEKEAKKEKIAEDKKELASTIEVKAADEHLLENLDVECEQKKLSFDEKQKLRADEIEAIGKASEILSGDDVSGNAAEHLGFAQTGSSFAQLRASSEGINRQVREFIASEGQRLHSKRLTLLSEKLAADPFAKIRGLIDDMITKLLEEANADAEKEGWCDTEMGKSKVTRNKLSEEIDGLDAAIEDGKATIMKLTQEVADLTKDIEDLDADMTEATDLRTEEKAKNKHTIMDAKAAQTAVSQATAVLKDFYAKAAKATALLQQKKNPAALVQTKGIKMGTEEWQALANPNFQGTIDKGHKAGMQTFGEAYTGNQDAAGGVMALLEVALSDFANLEADTKATEAEAESAYNKFMTESKRSKATKAKKIELDNSDKADTETKLQEDVAELKSTQDELIAADKYHEKLVPQCIDQGMTWEQVQAARQEEITSLKQALETLESQGNADTSA
jgi:septal ring factor EnvC (AmiA/AmiB activator)